MHRSRFSKLLCSAAGSALLPIMTLTPATTFAQDDDDVAVVEEIIVTGVVAPTNRLSTSISVSSLGEDDIRNYAPRGTSEIFRYLPGIRSESSAGGGNSNIGVRGLPIFTGGGQFVSLQEDGLPVLLFGDHNFAPNDTFTKIDSTLARVESVRGGTASTLTTNGNGAIINLINKTGRDEGGSLTVLKGIDYRDTRIDAEYGGEITDTMYFHVGGHFQSGGDVRSTGFNAIEGGKVRASVTKEFDNGYARIYAQFIDKKDATYMPQPVLIDGAPGSAAALADAANNSGVFLGRLNDSNTALAGLRTNNQTLHSAQLVGLPDIDGDGTLRFTDLRDGIRTKSFSVGGEFEFEFGDDWTINDKFRYSDISGVFMAPFPNAVSDADTLLAGLGGTGATIFNGANAGAAVSSAALTSLTGNNLITEITLFDTEFDDMSNWSNELRISKSIELDNSSVDIAFGYFKMVQNFQQDWHWGRFLLTTEDESALIQVDGVTENGVFTFNGGFGACCNILWDLKADVDAPYGVLTWLIGDFTVDGSVRYERMDYSGFARFSSGRTFDVNQDGVIGPAEMGVAFPDPSTRGIIDDSLDGVAYSFGVNYLVNDDLSVFGRYSRGVTWNFDRQFGAFNGGTDGSINNEDLLRDITRQWELGLKWNERATVPGNLDLYLTFFSGKAILNNTEVTTAQIVNATFEAIGVEFEAKYNYDRFNLMGNVTWTDAEITESGVPTQIGNTPRRQADWIYNFVASYFAADRVLIGANANGTSKSFVGFNNNFVQPGYAVFGAFINIDLHEYVTVSLNANNLFNTVGFTEGDETRMFDADGDGAVDTTIARSITGRTASVTLDLHF